MTDVFALVAIIAVVWYVLGRIEAHLLRTGARHPAQDETRLLPVYHLPQQGSAMSDEEFFAHLAQSGMREHLLEACREADAGIAPLPDAVLEFPRKDDVR